MAGVTLMLAGIMNYTDIGGIQFSNSIITKSMIIINYLKIENAHILVFVTFVRFCIFS